MTEWIVGVIAGVISAFGIMASGAGLNDQGGVRREGCAAAAYRILGGGALCGFIAFAVFRWLL